MTQQIETATVSGTITLTGNASVIVTSAYMTGSPKTLSVAVTNGDTASIVAGLIRTALAFDVDVAAQFIVSGTSVNIILTAHVARANDTTLNIAIDNGTCTGLTAAPTSANTTAGSGILRSYATLADYKAWIAVRGLNGGVGTDVNDDASIELLLEGSSRYLDRETGERFDADSVDATRYYTQTAHGGNCLRIDPLSAAPTSVSVDYTGGYRTYTVLDPSQYDLEPYNSLLEGQPYTEIVINPLYNGYFPTSNRGVKVIGKFGYPSVPTDIKDTCLMIAQGAYSTRSGQSGGGRITVTQAGVVIRPEEVPPMAQKTIAHYRSRI